MHCPYCRNTDTRVLDSRVADDGGSIRRRRTCSACEQRFTTVELMQLTVLKRSGATEPFTRDKAIAGVRKACKGRPVTEDELACLGQDVEDALPARRRGRDPGPRGRAGDPRPAARARRGRLPAVRQRLPRLRVRRRLRGRDRDRCAPSERARARHHLSPFRRADPDRPGASWGSGAPGAPTSAPRPRLSVPAAMIDNNQPRQTGHKRDDRDGERGSKAAKARRAG